MADSPLDVIVIGSGAGGLTAAVALANAGKRVLVLEQHDRPGGWCHSFKRKGFKFSPGVHYLGELGEEELFGEIFQGLGISGDLELCEMNPDGVDHLIIGDERMDVPGSRERFAATLKERFPEHRRGIDKYFRRMLKVAEEFMKADEYLKGWKVLQLPFRIPRLILFGNRKLQPYLDRVAPEPLLQAFLAGQAGIYGLPPDRVSQLVNSAITDHYGNGGYYPRGGAEVLPKAMVKQLERRGGALRTRAEVTRILVEDGRAVGVELADGERLEADLVVSNGDPHMTLGKLLAPEHLKKKTRKRLERTTYSMACVILFLATDMDLRAAGIDSGNYWLYDSPDLNGIYHRMQTGIPEELECVFVSVPTLKDPSLRTDGLHTLEVISMMPWEAFEPWKDQPWSKRDAEYEAFKEELTAKLLRATDRVIPGLSDRLVYQELGTPLTNYHFCRAHRGNMYGIEKTKKQSAAAAFPPKTDVKGLYMVGASTFLHGVMGVVISGLIAASEITGKSFEDLLKEEGPPLRIYPSEHPEQWLDQVTAMPDAEPSDTDEDSP